MPKLLFRAALIRYVDVRYDENSRTCYTKVNFTAAFTEPIREAMGWGVPSEGIESAKLDGELVATMLEMIPNGDLKQHGFDLEAKEIGGFKLHRIVDGDSVRNELRFQVTTTVAKAAQKLAAYLSVIGKGEAQLKVTYEAQSELENEAAELISEEQAADTTEAADAAGPTLLSVGKRHGARPKADKAVN